MSHQYETVLDSALKLSAEERAMLASALYQDLESGNFIHQGWLKESQRRADAVDRGEMTSRDADEVRADIRKLIRK